MTLHPKNRRPNLVSGIVQRPRLYERLDEGAVGSAILLSAPAGYGKSVLVNQWFDTRPEPAAWLSLDDSDNDLRLFHEDVIRAIRSVVPDACPKTLEVLEAPELPAPSDLAHCMINELDAIEARILLVFDNLETISNPDIYALLEIFLEYPRISVCLVLCTRRDPPVSLSKLKAREQLMEIRLEDLAFNAAETEELVEEAIKAPVSREALANLQARTEGWPVGLRLVTLTVKRNPDPNEELLNLDNGPRSIERYIDEEVLTHRSLCFRDCIYKASILDRFNRSLWEDVCCPVDCEHACATDEDDRNMRDPIRVQIEDGLFVIPVDAGGDWYRYHPLFRNLLRERLERRFEADAIVALHRRASAWFEAAGSIPESIGHALSAGDETLAAEIVERRKFEALNAGRAHDLSLWLGQLPGQLRRSRHGLLMAEAAIAFQEYELWTLSSILEFADAVPDTPESGPEQIFYRAVVDFFAGEIDSAMRLFRGLLDLESDAESWIQIHAYFFIGIGLHFKGKSDDAIRLIGAAIEHGVGMQHAYGISLSGTLIYLRLLRGELVEDCREATRLLESKSQRAASYGSYLLGIAALWRFDLESARDHLGRIDVLNGWLSVDGQVAIALVLEKLGRPEEADAMISSARANSLWSGRPHQLGQLESGQARIALLRGDLEAARRWQQSYQGDTSIARASIAVDFSEITECRVLAESDDPAELRIAADKLEGLSSYSSALHLTSRELEIGPIRALVFDRLGEKERALEILTASIEMAGQEDWIWPYVELGPPIAALLADLPKHVASRPLVKKIQRILGESVATTAKAPVARLESSADENLTNRELDVLGLLALRLRDKEIADRLVISTETVKTHLKSLYRKLDTRGRREAVDRARERNLLPDSQAPADEDVASDLR